MIDPTLIADLQKEGVPDHLIERVDRLRALVVLAGPGRRTGIEAYTRMLGEVARPRAAPDRDRARAAFVKAFPDGDPGRGVLRQKDLVRTVQETLEADGQAPVSPKTILRAAGILTT